MSSTLRPLVALDPSKDLAFEELLRALPGRQADWAEIWTSWSRAGDLARGRWVSAAEELQPGEISAAGAAQLNSFGATWELVRQLRMDRAAGLARIYFNPWGGDELEGGGDLLDAAWAGHELRKSSAVAYLDLAAAPGARTLELLEGAGVPAAILELGPGSSDLGLFRELNRCLAKLPGGLEVLVLGAGADGLWSDSRSDWEFTVEGMGAAAWKIGQFAAASGASVLVLGGRGSDEAPQQWLHVVSALAGSFAFAALDTVESSV